METSKERAKYRTTKKWKTFRRELIKKSGHKCMVCGVEKRGKMTRYLQVHHVNPDAYGNETEDDVVVLCASCHKDVERFLDRKEFDIDRYVSEIKNIYERSK
jgi:predicted HNH restriction endonuclease